MIHFNIQYGKAILVQLFQTVIGYSCLFFFLMDFKFASLHFKVLRIFDKVVVKSMN